MTREKAKQLLSVIQAIINGQKIQVNINNRWQDVDENHNCAFLPESYEYRIKPKSKYRPFKNAEECWEKLKNHFPFGWVKIEDSYDYITEINNQNIIINDSYFDFEAACKNITFADGTPFGVKVE